MKRLPKKILIAQDAVKSDKISEETKDVYRGLLDGYYGTYSEEVDLIEGRTHYIESVWEGIFLKMPS
jgi:hypothetical protein